MGACTATGLYGVWYGRRLATGSLCVHPRDDFGRPKMCAAETPLSPSRRVRHPGVVATKVGYFGVTSTKVHPGADGHKTLLKSVALAPGVLKCGAAPTPHRRAPPQKGLRSTPRAKLLNVGAAGRGGPKLLKLGPSPPTPGEAGSNLLKSDRRRHLTKRSSLHKKKSSSAGGPKLLKWGASPAEGQIC